MAAALAAVNAGFTGQGWEILTLAGSAGQEFLVFVGVPEPAELLMLVIGLGVLWLALPTGRTTVHRPFKVLSPQLIPGAKRDNYLELLGN